MIGTVAAIAVRAILVPNDGARGDIDQYAEWIHRLATGVPFGAAYRLGIPYLPAIVATILVLTLLIRDGPAIPTASGP